MATHGNMAYDKDERRIDLAEEPSAKAAKGDVPTVEWGRKLVVTLALTVLTSSQGLLIQASKQRGGYDYAVTTANLCVEFTKCLISLSALFKDYNERGVNDDNRLMTTWSELWVYPIPAFLYLIKNLMQYYIFLYVDAPSYQVLKNLNIISTGVLYRIFMKKMLNGVQWSALILLTLGCTISQLTSKSDAVLSTPVVGVVLAIVMALLSGAAGVYTEMIMKKRPQRSVNVQNFYLYTFGIFFNSIACIVQDYDQVLNNGFFGGYNFLVCIMILNHALSGLAVSLVMKYADNLVKVYSTSVAMLLTTIVSIPLFGFQMTLPFILGSLVVSVSVYLHYQSKLVNK